uniref:HAD-superfamily phosphatase, subfamily IIIC/FkbH-like domain-containing protein/thioester reductase domain-containing protein n=1 Tax=Candidatus Kentrum sp. TC TaxID=2126339 RepID=A0A450Y9X6_9GAMM|nr:MAG: HAD-superfamily phosphatase, subfamily IIIC/FkbH-like domain-containing protein/thioester reductase domain-containing protein [Candidatus Kentron sp. TC]
MHTNAVSSNQERLWYLSNLNSDLSVTFNIGAISHCRGSVDQRALKEAIARVVKKHSSLRTEFDEKDGEVISRQHPGIDIDLTTEPMTNPDEAGINATVSGIFRKMVAQPFDLRRAPLWRMRLLHVAQDHYRLLFVAHHIISDLRSIFVLFKAIQHEHELLTGGRPAPWPKTVSNEEAFELFLDRQHRQNSLEQRARLEHKIAGTRPLTDLGDLSRPESPSFEADTYFFPIPEELMASLSQWASKERLNPSAVMLAAFEVLIYRQANQEHFLLGFPVDGRCGAASKNAMGFFSEPMIIRANMHPWLTLHEVINLAQQEIKQSIRWRHTPFAVAAEIIEHHHGRASFPALQLLFNHALLPSADDPKCRMRIRCIYEGFGKINLDLWLTVQSSDERIMGRFDYNRHIFSDALIRTFAKDYIRLLETMVRKPDIVLDRVALSLIPDRIGKPIPANMVVAASFTADPILPILRSWATFFGQEMAAVAAPYQQVLQQLLSKTSLFANPDNAANIILIRPGDFFRYRAGQVASDHETRLIDELLSALDACIGRNPVPHLLGVCPGPSESVSERSFSERLIKGANRIMGIEVIAPDEWMRYYPVESIHDLTADELGHVPYTDAFFASMGTLLFRRWLRVAHVGVKVIVLDCDNTLWRGILGEDGVNGVTLDPGHLELHRFMIARQQAGVLLCLCSKNDQAIVDEFFETHADSILRNEHIVARRINWQSKSRNIAELAEELDLGLDSFVFIDDNPIEIEEVRAVLPQVLSLRLPRDPKAIPRFLDNLWALDIRAGTDEDRQRTRLYREQVERETFRLGKDDYLAFLHGLELEVDFSVPSREDLPRASQLTLRTNQFNFTTRQRTESELAALMRQEQKRIWAVRVSDHFGDYGFVGLLIADVGANASDTLDVDTFLLSCRALGRGVEHRMLAYLGAYALEHGIDGIRLELFPTERNQPAFAFLQGLGETAVEDKQGGFSLRLPAKAAAETVLSSEPATFEKRHSPKVEQDTTRGIESTKLVYVGERLTDVEAIMTEFDMLGLVRKPASDDAQSRDKVSEVFTEILRHAEVRDDQDFFEAGGTSLRAIRLLSLIQSRLGVTLDPTDFLRDPTPAAVRRLLAGDRGGDDARAARLREQMLRDQELNFSIIGFLEPEPILNEPQEILLTGATGFLGANLLNELIRATTAHIHVLARVEDDKRADDDKATRNRVRQTFDKYELRWGRVFEKRVTYHRGDLSEPKLGLSSATFDQLAGKLEAIIHCGAAVDFIQPYEKLKKTNVIGMREILALAVHARIKAVHYISTLGVLHGFDDLARDELNEGALSRFGDRLPTGYQQTKWVAEGILSRARERGLPLSIYRPGTIGGHSLTGAANPSDLWVRMMSAIHRMHAVPVMKDMDFLPVDIVAGMIVVIARDPINLGQTYHLCHPKPLPLKTLDRWFGLAGFNTPIISMEGWLKKLERFLEAHPQHMLASLSPVITTEDPQRNLFRILLASPPVSMRHTQAALARAGMTIPPITRELLGRYYDVFRERGWIPKISESDLDAFLLSYPEHMFGFAAVPGSDPVSTGTLPFVEAARIGEERGDVLQLNMTCFIETIYHLAKDRTIFVKGEVICPLLHPEPLKIISGSWRIRPHSGLTGTGKDEVVFLRYRMKLRDTDGKQYDFNGFKLAEARFDLWRQATTLNIEISDEEGIRILGRASIPTDVYLEDQVYGLKVNDSVSRKDRLQLKAAWLAFLGANIGVNYLEVALRKGFRLFKRL